MLAAGPFWGDNCRQARVDGGKRLEFAVEGQQAPQRLLIGTGAEFGEVPYEVLVSGAKRFQIPRACDEIRFRQADSVRRAKE